MVDAENDEEERWQIQLRFWRRCGNNRRLPIWRNGTRFTPTSEQASQAFDRPVRHARPLFLSVE